MARLILPTAPVTRDVLKSTADRDECGSQDGTALVQKNQCGGCAPAIGERKVAKYRFANDPK
jgi:hypothetical protein